jgi:hypothetical protein
MDPLTTFKKTEDGLLIQLTEEGREELLAEQVNDGEYGRPTNEIFTDLIEWHLGNGWKYLDPMEIGALTDSLILTDEAERNDHGELVKLGDVYWFPDYAVTCELNEMLAGGVTFTRVVGEDETPKTSKDYKVTVRRDSSRLLTINVSAESEEDAYSKALDMAGDCDFSNGSECGVEYDVDSIEYEGTEGQDRESYSDDQDRENYTSDEQAI